MRRLVCLLLAPLLLLVTALVAAPALAVHSRTIDYDVLGDSYGSGFGVPPYSDACGRSQSAYGVLVDGRAGLDLDDFVACAGATTTSLVTGGQLDALDADTDLVMLSIGGNDIGWSQAVVACLAGTDEQCAASTSVTRDRITTALPGLLDTVYADIAAAAPGARVLVTGYPRLFSPESGDYFGASPTEQRELNSGADLLNDVIETAAARHDFDFVDVTGLFRLHGVNARRPWVLGVTDPGAFHPTLSGYRAYAAAVTLDVWWCRIQRRC